MIIQNAVYIPESKTFLVAPANSEETISYVYGDGLALIIGGGFESAWRDGNGEGTFAKIAYAERYEEYALNDEYPIEVIRERLLAVLRNGPEEVATLIKDLTYYDLIEILDNTTSWATRFHHDVVRYWADQKETKALSGN